MATSLPFNQRLTSHLRKSKAQMATQIRSVSKSDTFNLRLQLWRTALQQLVPSVTHCLVKGKNECLVALHFRFKTWRGNASHTIAVFAKNSPSHKTPP